MKENLLVYSAPLQGFTEAAWRNAHARVFGGVAGYYTPFVRVEKGAIRNKDRREVAQRLNQVEHLVPQLIASEPDELEFLVQFLVGEGYQEMDLNMGCPFPLLTKRAKGAGILAHPDKIASLLAVIDKHAEVSFSVKMRLGFTDSDEWKAILPLLNASSVRQVTLHPRIGKQQYKGCVDMESFAAFYDSCQLPLVYNGDLTTLSQIQAIFSEFPHLKGVMLGRGLLADPSLALAVQMGSSLDEAALYARVLEMHQLIFDSYAQQLEGGDAQLLQKMKTIWEYLLPSMEKKARKAILKSTRLEHYLSNVRAALCPRF